MPYILAMRHPDGWQRIYPRAVRAEKDFSMIEPGDRILVGLSGGSDSLALLSLLAYQHKKIGKSLEFSLVPGHVPGSYRGRPTVDHEWLRRVCGKLGMDLRLSPSRLSEGIYKDCFRCSRARRKALFDLAEAEGCNKIALGHNADDLVETFLLNIFYSGRLAAFAPRQMVLGGKIALIRPLIFCWKADILAYARGAFGRPRGFRCPGGRDSRRQAVRRLLARMSKGNPHLMANLLKAAANPRLEYLPVQPGLITKGAS